MGIDPTLILMVWNMSQTPRPAAVTRMNTRRRKQVNPMPTYLIRFSGSHTSSWCHCCDCSRTTVCKHGRGRGDILMDNVQIGTCGRVHTGCSIRSRTLVWLTLILAVPLFP